MSGFRTPQYNAGGGNTGGRAGLSRHMYGDASDIFIDNDGNERVEIVTAQNPRPFYFYKEFHIAFILVLIVGLLIYLRKKKI